MYDNVIQQPRKRQRRQAAGMVVQSFFTMGKKSTAQPRPKLHVPPRGIGPVAEPNRNDVLCGRGGRINAHEGNVQFREIVQAHKKEYLAKTTKKLEKAHIAARIVEHIRSMNPPGRFLKEDPDGMWFDIGDAKAIKKAGQALREDAPDIRQELDTNSSGDEASKMKAPQGKKQRPASTASSKRPHQTGNSLSTEQKARTSNAETSSYQWAGGHEDPFVIANNNATLNSLSLSAQRTGENFHGAEGSSRAGMVTKRALEAIRPAHPGTRGAGILPPHQVAFGRNFTPTELSGGSTMSTISGFSGVSGLSATDTQMMGSALSLGSSGFGAASLRTNQMSLDRLRHRGNRVSDLTHSFMSISGLSRSPSFGELSAQGDVPMSDASIKALMQTGTGFDLPVDNQGLSTISGNSLRSKSRRNHTNPTAMSIASAGSVVSSTAAKSMASTNSWLHPIASRTAGSICSEDNPWLDDRSYVSDVSDSLVALDLASAATKGDKST